MRPSRMQLKEYFVAESFFRAQPKYFANANKEDFKLNSSDLQIEVALGQREEVVNEKICELSISLKGDIEQNSPYIFSIVLLGFFTLDESCAGEEAELLLKTNAPAVLYSAAREFLLLTTGRSLFTPLMLPTVTFLPAGEEIEAAVSNPESASPTKSRLAKPKPVKAPKKLKS